MKNLHGGWLTTDEIARMAGVHTWTVLDWMKRNAHPTQMRQIRRRWYVHANAASAYLNRNNIPSGKPSGGMIPMKRIEELGFNRMTVHRCMQREQIRAVRYRGRVYVNKYDVKHKCARKPPEGWISLDLAAERLGISKRALKVRLRKAGYKSRPVGRIGYIDANWLDEIRDIVPAGWVLASEYGDRDTVVKWAKRNGCEVRHYLTNGRYRAYIRRECGERKKANGEKLKGKGQAR